MLSVNLSLFLVVSHLMLMASPLFENSNLRYVVLDTNAGQSVDEFRFICFHVYTTHAHRIQK